MELLLQTPRNEASTARLEEATHNFEQHKESFEKLRSDVAVKLKFLDENRVNIFLINFVCNIIFEYFPLNDRPLCLLI